MSITGERLRKLREEAGKTRAEMAKDIGLSVSAISNYENNIRIPKNEIMEMITDYFNVDTDYVLGRSDVKNSIGYDGVYKAGVRDGKEEMIKDSFKINPVPIYDPISCGNGTWVEDIPTDYIGIPNALTNSGNSYFSNPAEGDSMEPKIHNGDYVIFRRTDQIESGKIGSFAPNGEYYCKRFKKLSDGSFWLFSENENYEPIPIKPTDEFRVLGEYSLRLTKD